MEIYTNTSTATSAWGAPACRQPLAAFGIVPNAQFQGTGLSAAATPAYVITDGMGLTGADKARHTVPDPRGRTR